MRVHYNVSVWNNDLKKWVWLAQFRLKSDAKKFESWCYPRKTRIDAEEIGL